jgi:hypothetical protein
MTAPDQPSSVAQAADEDEVPALRLPPITDESVAEQPSLFGDPPMAARREETHEREAFLDRALAIDGNPSPVYLGSLILGSLLLMGAAALGIFPWAASALATVGLMATMFRGGYWVTLACSVAVVVFAGAALWPREPTLADVVPTADTSQDEDTTADEIPEGSLGFQLNELTDLWNDLDQPPKITRGFSLSSEPGLLDGFVIRFDQGASLAGAYNPQDDFVYALSASSRLDHEAATTMYLHLCFLLHPYSQECIDAYWEKGVDGGTPGDYLGTRHSAEWRIGGQTWRLAIVGNVQEVKVLGDPPT